MGSTSLKNFDVAIVSAFSRGLELAHQLTQSHQKVMFIDVTSSLNCSSEDLLGPFGFFKIPETPQRWIESEGGFSIQTNKESFYFKDFFLSSIYKNRSSFASLRQPSLYGKDFKTQWIHHLISRLTSSLEKEMVQSYDLPLTRVFKPFGILSSPPKIEKVLSKDVTLFQNKNWNKKGLVLSCEKEGEIQVQKIILLLNPEELYRFNADWYSSFFSQKKMNIRWSWQRFSFQFNDDGYHLPSHLVLADPENLPWTHERMLCLKRSLISKNQMDVWGLFPAHYSMKDFNVELIQEQLNHLLPQFGWEYQKKSFVTPSFLFPVYSQSCVRKMKAQPSHFCGWPMHDISENGWLRQEKAILQQVS